MYGGSDYIFMNLDSHQKMKIAVKNAKAFLN